MTKSELYTKSKLFWNGLFAKETTEKLIWQRISTLQFILIICLMGIVYKTQNPRVLCWLIEVDSLGRTVAVGQAKPIEITSDRIVQAHLINFVEMSRSVIGDPELMRRNFERTYQLVTPEVRGYLNSYYEQNNPMDQARRESKEVVVLSFLKETRKTYIVEWKEITRDLTNKVIDESRYKGLFTITQPKEVKSIENPHNPFGIIINNISWGKVLK